jgi:MFS family permease
VAEEVVEPQSSSPETGVGGPLGRAFWTLVTASGLSNLADGIFKVALPLVALRYTRAPSLIAGLEVVRSAPWLLFALQVGALADRWDRRRTMLAANVVRGALVALPVVGSAAGFDSIWLLFVAAAGTGVAEVFYDTSAQSILPALVPRARLNRANGRLYAVELGAQQFAAPPLAGFLVAAAAVAAMLAPTVLWVLAVGALWMVRGSYRPVRASTDRTTIRQDVAEGARFLWRNRMLRVMAVMVGGANLTAAASFPLLVLYAVGDESTLGLDDRGFGILLLAAAMGSLVASVVSDPIMRRLGRARTLTVSIVTMALFVGGPALTTDPVVLGVLLAAGGFGVMLWNIPTVSFRQSVTPDHLLGRVNSAYRLLAWGTMPVGAALGGFLGEILPIRAVFAIMGILSLLLLIPNRVITDARLEAEEARADAS